MEKLPPRKEIEKSIIDTFGFKPEFFDALPDSALPGAWSLHQHLEMGESKLDDKTKQLIGLAMASHIKCQYCIYFHTRGAEFAGATPAEIREAIAMGGLTVLMSNSVTGTQVDLDKFKVEVDKALEFVAAKAA